MMSGKAQSIARRRFAHLGVVLVGLAFTLGSLPAWAETPQTSACDPALPTEAANPSGGQILDRSTVGNTIGFKGLPVDPETGLIYVRNRYYDPELGRFITNDPLEYVDGPSQYSFAMNSPTNFTDPSGLSSRADIGRGELFYTWHLGWLDVNHMQTSVLREPWERLVVAEPGEFVTFTLILEQADDLSGWQRALGYKRSEATFRVKVLSGDLTTRKRQLLGAWQHISAQFEQHQGTGIQGWQWVNTLRGITAGEEDKIASSFSTEDLVSNLVAFYSTVEGRPWQDIVETVGGPLGADQEKKFSYLLWDHAGFPIRQHGNKTWRPRHFDPRALMSQGDHGARSQILEIYLRNLKRYGPPQLPKMMLLTPTAAGVEILESQNQ